MNSGFLIISQQVENSYFYFTADNSSPRDGKARQRGDLSFGWGLGKVT
jgi:hypothetical protein